MLSNKSLLILFLSWVSILSQEDVYDIPAFIDDTATFPVSGNNVITPFEGSALSHIRDIPHCGPDEVLLRRRFSQYEYGLYFGKKDMGIFSDLSAFKPPEGTAVDMFVGKKLYLQETENPNLDIANVYFDNDNIYVENAARLYFFDKKWHVLSLAYGDAATMTVLSFPDSALVYLDNIQRGRTNLTIEGIQKPFGILTIKKKGYYLQDYFMRFEPRKHSMKKFVLAKTPQQPIGTYIDPDNYTAESRGSIIALEREIVSTKEQIAEQRESNEEALEQFEQEYRELEAQGEFEKTADFLKRKEIYHKQKKQGRLELELQSSPELLKLEEALTRLTNYRREIDNRLYYKHFTTETVTLYRYEPDLEYFPVDIKVNKGGHQFTFTGTLSIPLSLAQKIREQLGLGLLKLTYRNRIFTGDKPIEEVKVLYEYVKFSLLFKGSEFLLEGTCTFPGKISAGNLGKAVIDTEKRPREGRRRGRRD